MSYMLLIIEPPGQRQERSEGPILGPGDEAARLTGIEAVLPRDNFAAAIRREVDLIDRVLAEAYQLRREAGL